MAPNLRFLAELLHNVYGLPLEPVVGEDGGMIADSRSKCEDLNPSVKVQDVKTVSSPKKDLRGEGAETPVSEDTETKPKVSKERRTKIVEKNMKEGGIVVKASRSKQTSCLDTTDERVGDLQTGQAVVAVDIEDGGASTTIGQVGKTEPFNPNASRDQMSLELHDQKGGVNQDAENALLEVPQDIPLTATSRSRIRSKVASAGRDLKLKVSSQMRGEENIKDAEILLNPPRNRSRPTNQVRQKLEVNLISIADIVLIQHVLSHHRSVRPKVGGKIPVRRKDFQESAR